MLAYSGEILIKIFFFYGIKKKKFIISSLFLGLEFSWISGVNLALQYFYGE